VLSGPQSPAFGLFLALVAFCLWLANPPLQNLDRIAGALLFVDTLLGLNAYVRGRHALSRKLGVIGMGAGVFGLVLLGFLFITG
jgi:hypothetical protein